MKIIKLTQGKQTIVDDEDYEKLAQHKWYATFLKSGYYAMRTAGKNGKRKATYMAREILNAPKGFHTDHINHNTLDNRKRNLRLATVRQNQGNRRIQNNRSGYKGVVWVPGVDKWSPRIRIMGKRVYLGLFKDVKDAALVYNQKAREVFGKYAYLNNIKKDK